MSSTQTDVTLVEELQQKFLTNYYRDEIGDLAQKYPREKRSLTIDYGDVFKFDSDIADDLLTNPKQMIEYFEEALRQYELPIDISLSRAHVRITGLPDAHTYYPGEFSPSEHHRQLRSIQGEVVKAVDAYSRMDVAAFECKRCGSLTRIPQRGTDWQEPYECQGCERQGPFHLNYDQCESVDAQKLRIQTPPEIAQGEGKTIDAFVEDDLADVATTGDRITATGLIKLEQQGGHRNRKNKFDPFLVCHGLDIEQTDAQDMDITAAKRQEIEALARGEHGDPLELAAESYAPKIYGYETVKKALILALVGGSRIDYEGKDSDRGEFHVLLIGDPSTGKSKLVERAEQVGWRAVGVSGTGSTVAGVTATAVQDDFGDGSWTLDAGAAVKAHRGVLAIDELDDMPAEVRSALLEPMSKQSIHVTKGGINTTLRTETAVVAAANPKMGRFDPYTPPAEQFSFTSTLLSRFDLVYTFQDKPDEDGDGEIADHMLRTRDAQKRKNRGMHVDEEDDPEPPVSEQTLREWIALAKQQPDPVNANDNIRVRIKDAFTNLRSMYGEYDPDDPVPVTWRKLEGINRVAEAAARFEFSDVITDRHVSIATELVRESMSDIGKDPETGKLDADIIETGSSKSQKKRREEVVTVVKDMQVEGDDFMVRIDDVVEELDQYDSERIREDIAKWLENGVALQPQTGYVRYIGKH